MATLLNANGEYVDMSTGEVVGVPEGSPTASDPRAAANDRPSADGSTLAGIGRTLQQLSWGFNAGMFALPDAGVKAIGQGLGMDESNVMTLTKLFNKGERPGTTVTERYARAISEGVGAGMPFTGLLAGAARFMPMARPAVTASQGMFKNIADEAISFAQKSPKLAAAVDIAFNAGYEGLRQGVEENVDDSNPNKTLYKELLPMGAFIGLPVAASYLPSAVIAKYGAKKIKALTAGLPEVEQDVMDGLPRYLRLPGMKIIPRVLMKNAERKLTNVFGPIEKSPEAQEAMRLLADSFSDPRIAEAGFQFDVAERTLYSPLMEQKAKLLEQLGPRDLEATKARINENQRKLQDLMERLSPEANKDLSKAFLELQAERADFFKSLTSQRKGMTDAEAERLANVYGPLDVDMINDELRGIIYSGMEMDKGLRSDFLSQFNIGTAPDGTMLPTRREGVSLHSSVDMESAVSDLVSKYRPERPSMRNPVPAPVALLDRFQRSQLIARAEAQSSMVDDLLEETIVTQLSDLGVSPAPGMVEALRSELSASLRGVAKKNRKGMSLSDLASAKDAEGFISVPSGTPGKKLRINLDQIADDATRLAAEQTKIDINLPEAMDYLESAMRYRNDALMRYNNAMKRGGSGLADAKKILDKGEAVFKDIESLVLAHVPKINKEYGSLKQITKEYRDVYEQSLPLLMTERTPRGGKDAFLLPNEKVMQTAFKTSDGVRQLGTLLGTTGDPRGQRLMELGAYDWLRSKKVFDNDGLIDPRKIKRVLSENQNIVNAMPEPIRAKILDEVSSAEGLVARLGEIDQRMVQSKDIELDGLVQRATRQDADPAQVLEKAMKDPASMRTLVNAFKGDSEKIASLRRSVFDMATQGTANGGALQSFLDTNRRSLKVLFDESHLTNLSRLADLQRRVNAFADVTGQIPQFESLDQSLKGMFGAGIQYITTTMREAAVGRIRPETGMLALMIRLIGTTENKLYNRIFTKALENPQFANQLVSVSTPAQAKVVAIELQKIGIDVPSLLRKLTPVKQELGTATGDEQVDIPERQNVAEIPAREMLRQLPPAPKLGFSDIYKPAAPAPSAGGGTANLLYPQLFPNDPISGMLEQRAAAQQSQAAVPPQQ